MNLHTHHTRLGRACLIGLLGLGGLTLAAPRSVAQAPPAKSASAHSGLMLLLSAHHELPEKSRFEETGPDVVKQLHAIIGSKDVLRAHKYRALEALATYWPGADTTALFSALGAAPEHPLMAHQLMVIASKHLPATDATALIAPYLAESDEQLRYTAVDALGRIDTTRSRELLTRALSTEKSAWVKAHIESMLIELE